jgi:VWFA-related protein
MKPRILGFVLPCLLAVVSPAQAEWLSSLYGLFGGPSALPGVAVPRPINGHPVEPLPPGERTHEGDQDVPHYPASRLESPENENFEAPGLPLGWDGRRMAILGIDRTEFPEMLVLFSLRDSEGIPVVSVAPAALELTEDEAPQRITSLVPCVPEHYPGEPLRLVFLIDSSGSMQRYIDVVQNAAARCAQRLKDEDQGAVIGFCNQPVLLCPLTTSQKHIQKGIYKVVPRGFTALYDAAYMGVQTLNDCGGRKAIVLLTDGRDDDGTGRELSKTKLETVLSMARNVHVPIFAVGLGRDISRPVLEKMANETGGDFMYAPEGKDVDTLFRRIARQLGRGDEGYYKATYRATEGEKDGSSRTIIMRYNGAQGVAAYPAPRRFFWPLSKVF